MLVLKLRRAGKKHQPSFHLVVMEKRSKLTGKYVDELGWYNPHTKKHGLDKDRILHWLKSGAQKTDTVHNLLIKIGVIEGKKTPVHKKSKKTAPQSEGEVKEIKVDQSIKEKTMEELNQNPMVESEPGNEAEMPQTPEAPEGMPTEQPASTPPVEGAPAEEPAVPAEEVPAVPVEEQKTE